MLKDFSGSEHIYIACGYTDLRKGIDGLSLLVQQSFLLDPFGSNLFLFCGKRSDWIKGKRQAHRHIVRRGTRVVQ